MWKRIGPFLEGAFFLVIMAITIVLYFPTIFQRDDTNPHKTNHHKIP